MRAKYRMLPLCEINFIAGLNSFTEEFGDFAISVLKEKFGDKWPERFREALYYNQQEVWDMDKYENCLPPEELIDVAHFKPFILKYQWLLQPFFRRKTKRLLSWLDDITDVRNLIVHFKGHRLRTTDIPKGWIHMISIAQILKMDALEKHLLLIQNRKSITEKELENIQSKIALNKDDFDNKVEQKQEIDDATNKITVLITPKPGSELFSEKDNKKDSVKDPTSVIPPPAAEKSSQEIETSTVVSTEVVGSENVKPTPKQMTEPENLKDKDIEWLQAKRKEVVEKLRILKQKDLEARQNKQKEEENFDNKVEQKQEIKDDANKSNELIEPKDSSELLKEGDNEQQAKINSFEERIGAFLEKMKQRELHEIEAKQKNETKKNKRKITELKKPDTKNINSDFKMIHNLKWIRLKNKKIIINKTFGKIVFDFDEQTITEERFSGNTRIVNYKDIINKFLKENSHYTSERQKCYYYGEDTRSKYGVLDFSFDLNYSPPHKMVFKIGNREGTQIFKKTVDRRINTDQQKNIELFYSALATYMCGIDVDKLVGDKNKGAVFCGSDYRGVDSQIYLIVTFFALS